MEYLILEQDKRIWEKNGKKKCNRKEIRNKIKRISVIRDGKECKKCGGKMERRTHFKIDEKQLKKPYYFSEWDYCKPCGHIQFYEKFKVWNNNQKSKELKLFLEGKEMNNKFNSLFN